MFHSSISSSDRTRAMRFTLRVATFAAPLLAGALVVEVAFFRTGESWPTPWAIARQSTLPQSLYGRQYFSQQYNLYKTMNIRQRTPTIVILGSSRVMQFRDFLFHPFEKEFYNGGGLIQNLADVIAYANQVRSGSLPKPHVLVLGIDPWWLKPGDDQPQWITQKLSDDAAFRFAEHVQAARSLLREENFPWEAALTGEMKRSPLYEYPAFGLAALRYGDGERKDGSHLYTPKIRDFIERPVYRDREAPPIIQRVREGSHQFRPASALDSSRTRSFIAALSALKASGVEIYTFEPLFSCEVLRALNASKTGWWIDYRDRLPSLIREAGVVCLPVACPADFGLDDAYMLDGFHPSEVLDSYLVERFAQASPGGALATVDLAYIAERRARPNVLPVAFDPPPATRLGIRNKLGKWGSNGH